MIERHIDYLQMSVPLQETEFRSEEYEVIAPIRFYKRGYRNTNGIRFFFGNPNSDKALVVASGFALMFERENFKNDAAMLDYWMKKNATISRIDLAITDWIEDDFCTVSDVQDWFAGGFIESVHVAGGCKAISEVQENGGTIIETLYIGDIRARGRKGIFRAYDKGIESGLLPELATRLELEFKSDNAHSTALRIARSNDISGNFRAKFNVNHVQFERLMDAPTADTTRGEALPKREADEEMQRRWKWLIETVAPSLCDAIAHDRKYDKLDTNLIKFLIASGINEEIRSYARAFRDKVLDDSIEHIDLLD